MTDRSKFEQMLEYLISEEEDKAKELFHQLVVEKSREIYENILAEDFAVYEEDDEEEKTDEAKEDDDEEKVEEASDDEEQQDEGFGFEGSDDDEGDDMGEPVGGDATDDFMGDIEAGDDEGDDMGGEGDIEDRVMDLEDALDELKAEFEKMMSGEEGDDMGDMGDDEMGMGMDSEEEPKMDSFDVSDNFMREYIEKVSNPKHGDNGANTKSIIDNMKNDMGGTTANIVKGGEAKGEGTKGGLLAPSTKEENFGNINVPGGNAGKTAFKKKEPGHGAEKKQSGGDMGDKGASSPINGVKSRAK